MFSSFQGKIEGGMENAMVTRQMFYRVRYINLVFHWCITFHVTCGFFYTLSWFYGFVVNSMHDATLDGLICLR